MKKNDPAQADQDTPDELLPEYRFDYTTARPNRFASQLAGTQVMITLDPDVAEVFNTSESVNTILRALITAMPARRAPKPTRNRPANQ